MSELSLQETRYRHLALEMVEAGQTHKNTVEVLGTSYFIDPKNPWMSFEERHLNVPFVHRELEWYVNGDRNDDSIALEAMIWDQIFTLDGMALSNYGHVLFRRGALRRVVDMLTHDEGTRRAVVYLGENKHVGLVHADQPCTNSMQFIIREGFLHTIVTMRSQDFVYGIGSDSVLFSMIHMLVARAVGAVPAHVQMQIGSLHVYDRHRDMLQALLNPTSKPEAWRHELLSPGEAIDVIDNRATDGPFMQWVKSVR